MTMSSPDPILICFSYEYRSAEEAEVYEQIKRMYAEKGIPLLNLFDPEIHAEHEGGFNLARWEALCRHVEEYDLFDRRIVMQDITDVYVVDPDLEFDEHDVFVNRKKNCQYFALKTLWRDIISPDLRSVNFARRINIDCTSLDSAGLKELFVDRRYRSIYRFSNDVLWGHGRNFVTLFETIGRHIEQVPDAIRFGNCDESLFTYFHLHLADKPLNLKFGERFCQNYNYISQEIFGAASAGQFVRSKRIFTYQHSARVPELIMEMSLAKPGMSLGRAWSAAAYVLDQVVSGALSAASVILQELKRMLIAGLFLRRRFTSS